MSTPSSVAIYARISSDPDGTALGVDRQLLDCHEKSEALGWVVGQEYVDNDVSAFSKKPRPAFEQMLEDIDAGLRDGVICYHIDRLTRRNKDLDRFVEVVDRRQVTSVRFVTGSMNLASDDGLFMARVMAAFAENESATKSRRIRRKNQEKAAQGLPHASSNRPFGYESDGVTVIESEAVVIRDLVARLLAGEPLRSLARSLDEAGVTTGRGNPWRTTTLKSTLTSPRIAGFRSHNGEVAAKAVWPAIISEEDHRRVLRHFETKKATGRRPPRRYLLSGMLRCGKCGHPLFSSARPKARRYVCLSGPDHGGCGGLTVVAPPVEEWVAEIVLHRLDTATLADALAGRRPKDERTAALSDELATNQIRLHELADAYGAGLVTMTEWLRARESIEARIRSAQNQLAASSGDHALQQLLGTGAHLREQWSTLNLQKQSAIVRTVLDHAVIAPGKPGAREVDVDRIQPMWRL